VRDFIYDIRLFYEWFNECFVTSDGANFFWGFFFGGLFLPLWVMSMLNL